MKCNWQLFHLAILTGFVGLAMPASPQPASVNAEIASQLQGAVSKCWGTVADLSEPERLSVTIQFSLDQDGILIGEPNVIAPSKVADYDEDMHVAVNRAVRAIKKCAPYDFLPIEYYERWQHMTFRFKHEPHDKLAIPLG